MQEHWIGRSEGVEFALKIAGSETEGRGNVTENNAGTENMPAKDLSFRVFTTRPDTVFGMTFLCVVTGTYSWLIRLRLQNRKRQLMHTKKQHNVKTKLSEQQKVREKDGVFTGAFAINPMNGEPVANLGRRLCARVHLWNRCNNGCSRTR